MAAPRVDEIAHTVLAGDWRAADIDAALRAAEKALAVSMSTRPLELSVAFADDSTVRQLNRDYRGKDSPTNVLSFDTGEDGAPDGPILLGDVVIALETCIREAEGMELVDHLSHLAIHGVLHLLGYDHETDSEALEMEALEVKILADMGIANPYLEDLETASSRRAGAAQG